MAIHASLAKEVGHPFRWLAFYVLGIVVGLVGIITIAPKQLRVGGQEAQNVKIITGSFGGVLGVVAVINIVVLCCSTHAGGGDVLMVISVVSATLSILSAFYSDMIIAAVANHWSGPPHRFQTWYWLFFAAKRFPLFSV